MKSLSLHHFLIFLLLFGISPTLAQQAPGLPSGQETPEGAACDAMRAFCECDSKTWLATLVRPIFGSKNKEYEAFKKKIAASADALKKDADYYPPRLVKCYKARTLRSQGPAAAACAIGGFQNVQFVDLVLELSPDEFQTARYHMLQDKDQKWYLNPRPDLCPLYSKGLHDESPSKEEWSAPPPPALKTSALK